MRILFLSRWFPYPPDNGSKQRIYHLLRLLSATHEIDLISFYEEQIDDKSFNHLKQFCAQVEIIPYKQFNPRSLRALKGYFSYRPRSVEDTCSHELHQLVVNNVRTRSPDLIIASQRDMAPYARNFGNTPKLLEELEVSSLLEQYLNEHEPLRKYRKGLMWWKMRINLEGLLKDFDATTVVSQVEANRVKTLVPLGQSLEIVPNGIPVEECRVEDIHPVQDTLIYSGALTFDLNLDAVSYFLQEIFNDLRDIRPQVTLTVTGSTAGVPLESLPHTEGLILTGYLPDVRPQIAKSWLSVVPLRQGGGTRIKILESMAIGTPVVSTPKGAEGLNFVPEKEILIADSPEEFRQKTLRVLEDEDLRARLSERGRKAVADRYDWNIIVEEFEQLIVRITGNRIH